MKNEIKNNEKIAELASLISNVEFKSMGEPIDYINFEKTCYEQLVKPTELTNVEMKSEPRWIHFRFHMYGVFKDIRVSKIASHSEEKIAKIIEEVIVDLKEELKKEINNEMMKMATRIANEEWGYLDGMKETDECVYMTSNVEWYDNVPFFATYVEDGVNYLYLGNSESCFYESVSVDDPTDVKEVYGAINILSEDFYNYFNSLDEDTIAKCEEEGSCCVNDCWIA